jgi:hypothetical protein
MTLLAFNRLGTAKYKRHSQTMKQAGKATKQAISSRTPIKKGRLDNLAITTSYL